MWPDDERSARTWRRLLRRRANRVERGVTPSLVRPVPAGSMDEPLPPTETQTSLPRPLPATVAAALLAALGASLGVAVALEFLPAIAAILGEPAVDGITALAHWLIAGFFTAVLGAMLAVAAAHLYAAWRIVRGVNWGWVEGLAVAPMGALASAVTYGVSTEGGATLSIGLAVAIAGYVAVVVCLLVSRRWFGEIRLPLLPGRGPWWLRIGARRWL